MMKDRTARAMFAILAVAIMLAVPLTLLAIPESENYLDADSDVVLPKGHDYGFVLTTGAVRYGSVDGETIIGVRYGGADGVLHDLYTDVNDENLLYTTINNALAYNTAESNPNNNEVLRFSEITGIGPFNSFYAAVNIGNTSGNGDLHRCSSANGDIAYILNPYDLSQAIVSSAPGEDGYTGGANVSYYDGWTKSDYNVMLVIPTVYWYSDPGDDTNPSRLYLSNRADYFDDVSSGLMIAYAHTVDGVVRPYLALGVYESSTVDGKLVSQSGLVPTREKTTTEFRDLADNLNTGTAIGEYMIWNYYQWTLYKMMSYTVMGTKNSQVAIGSGITTTNGNNLKTGDSDDQAPYWGGVRFDNGKATGSYTNGKYSVRMFLENAWGSVYDSVDDAWFYDGQLHAGQNSIAVIKQNINPNASYRISNNSQDVIVGSDHGMNENQPVINNAKINRNDGTMSQISTTYKSSAYWDLPATFANSSYRGIGDAVQFSNGNQTMYVGGHYDSRDSGGIERITVRNGFGKGFEDIGTRLAFVTFGGTLTYTAGDYKVMDGDREVPSGTTVVSGTDLTVVSTNGEGITAVYMNGEEIDGSSFTMPPKEVNLEVVVGNVILKPNVPAFVYDGTEKKGLYESRFFTNSGEWKRTDAGTYTATATLKDGFVWWDGTTEPKQFEWTIKKATLMIEGSSAAAITKPYDNSKELATDAAGIIDREDLFIYGLAAGESPGFTYSAQYLDWNAGINKRIRVNSLTLSDNGDFRLSNYEYTFKSFIITGASVIITAISLTDENTIIGDIDEQVYSGEEITPEPTVKYNSKTLVKNTNFTFSYTDNIDAGTATVTVTGKGNYTSSVSKTYTIAKLLVEWPDVVERDFTGSDISAGLQDGERYTVEADAVGLSPGDYDATLLLKDPDNTRWADTEGASRTAKALTINDISNQLSFDLLTGTWLEYVPQSYYMSSLGLALPDKTKVKPYSKYGYTVTFKGWYDSEDTEKTLITEIPANQIGAKTIVAMYEETKVSYTVTFEMWNLGTGTIAPIQVEYQSLVPELTDEQSAMLVDPGYTFIGWYKESSLTTPWDFGQDTVVADTTLFAKWEQKTFTVTWIDWNGAELYVNLDVPYGSTPIYGGVIPQRAPSDGYSYILKGWTSTGNDEDSRTVFDPITEDTTYKAVYDATKLKYTVTLDPSSFYTLASEQSTTVEHGDTFTFTLTMNEAYSQSLPTIKVYTVIGNDKTEIPLKSTEDGVNTYEITVTSNVLVTAGNIQLNKYDITWTYHTGIDGGEFIDETSISEGVNWGVKPPAPTDVPASISNEQYTWTFKGWNEELDTAENRSSYTAKYERTTNQYSLSTPDTANEFTIHLYELKQEGPEEKTVYSGVKYDYGTQFRITIQMSTGYTEVVPTMAKNGTEMTATIDGLLYSYEFTIDGDVEIDFTGTIVPNIYTVTWVIDGDNVKTSKTAHWGTPSYPGATDPTKTSDIQGYEYVFTGWDPEVGQITGPVTYTAQFESVPITYKVRLPALETDYYYVATDAEPNDDGTYDAVYGTEFTFNVTLKAAYTDSITGLSADLTVNDVSAGSAVSKGITDGVKTFGFTVGGQTSVKLTGIQMNSYTVTWKYQDETGEEQQKTTKVIYGGAPKAPDFTKSYTTPAKSYEFSAWSPAITPETSITSDTTFTAQYTSEDRYYNLTVPNDTSELQPFTIALHDDTDDSVIADRTGLSFKYGTEFTISLSKKAMFSDSAVSLVSANTTFAKVAETENTYTFTLTEDTAIGISGSFQLNKYQITWMNDDGTSVIKKDTVSYGTVPAYDGDTPVSTQIPSTGHYYRFTGWDSEPVAAFADATYTATYEETPIPYSVKISNSNFFTHSLGAGMDADAAPYGSEFTFTITPNAGYSQSVSNLGASIMVGGVTTPIEDFVRGSTSVTFTFTVTGDTTVAISGIELNSYQLKWNYKDANNGDVSKTVTTKYGSTPQAPDHETTVVTVEKTYTFTGWSTDPATIASVQQDYEFTASYSEATNRYELSVPDDTESVTVILEKKVGDVYTAEFEKDANNEYLYGTCFRVTMVPTEAFSSSAPKVVKKVGNDTVTSDGDSMEFAIEGRTVITVGGTVEMNMYTIRWFDGVSETPYYQQNVLHGTAITDPSDPTKESTVSEVFAFTGWHLDSGTVTDGKAMSDVTYTAQYSSSPRTYHITLPTIPAEIGTVGPAAGSDVDTVYGGSFTFEFATDNTDHEFSWKLDGAAIELSDGKYTISDIQSDHVVTVNVSDKPIITWKNHDGSVLSTQVVDTGSHPVYPGSTVPTKATDVQYIYSFAGWSPAITNETTVTEDIEYTATFSETIRSYTVTLQQSPTSDFTYTGYTTTTVDYGETFTFSIVLSDKFSNSPNVVVTKTDSSGSTELTAVQGQYSFAVIGDASIAVSGLAINTYTITWKYYTGYGEGGDLIEDTMETQVKHGSMPQAPSVPGKLSNVQFTTTFTGDWDSAIATATADRTYTAQYATVTNEYSLTLPDDSGDDSPFKFLLERKVVTNETVSYVTETGRKNLKFPYGTEFRIALTMDAKFDQHTPVMTCNGADMAGENNVYTFTILGSTALGFNGSVTINMYTVVWENYDGTVLTSASVPYGTTPSYSGKSTPANNSAIEHGYYWMFNGWSPQIVPTVDNEADYTYTAQFVKTPISYKISVSGGSYFSVSFPNNIDPNDAPYGSTFTFTVTPVAGYTDSVKTMKGFTVIGGTETEISKTYSGDTATFSFTVTDNASVKFTGIGPNQYTIKWTYMDSDATEKTDIKTAVYGQKPQAPAVDQKVSNAQYTWEFTGWSPEVSAADSDVTYVAQYTQTTNVYSLIVPNDSAQFSIVLKKVVGENYEIIEGRDNLSYEYGTQFELTLTMKTGFDKSVPKLTKNGTVITDIADSGAYAVTIEGTTSIGFAGTITINTYDITWYDWNGTTVLSTTKVVHGYTPSYSGSAQPYRESDKTGYEYVPDGWTTMDGNGGIAVATSDASYKAKMVLEPVTCKITLPSTSYFDTSTAAQAVNGAYYADYDSDFSFTVTMKDGYRQSIGSLTISAIVPGSQPKAITDTVISDNGAQKTFTFKVQGNTTFSIAGISIDKFTVTWNYKDADGNDKSATTTVRYNDTPAAPDIPGSYSNVQYTWGFDSWSPVLDSNTKITSAGAVFDATYKEPVTNEYELTVPGTTAQLVFACKLDQGTVDVSGATTLAEYGSTYILTVTKTAAFNKSAPIIMMNGSAMEPTSTDGDTSTYTLLIQGNTAISVTGKISINMYTVKWFDEDGTELYQQKIAHGNPASYPGATVPTKESTTEQSFEFDVWTTDAAAYGSPVTSDVNYTATYKASPRIYIIMWLNYDSSYLTHTYVGYGSTPVYPNEAPEPTKPSDDYASYTFNGWEPAVHEVTGNETYVAQYTTVKEKFKVTWLDWDGSILEFDDRVPKDSIPIYDGDTPTRPASAQYTYTFTGWLSNLNAVTDATPVTNDVTYTAIYNSVVNKYTVLWADYNGVVLETDSEMPYGTVPAYDGDTPTRPASAQYTYTFTGWDREVSEVTGDTTYFAQYSSTVNKYEVRWMLDGTTVLKTETLEYGQMPEYEGVPPIKTEPADMKHTWTGWYPAVTAVTGDATYTATFEDSVFSVHVTVKVSDEQNHNGGTVLNAGTFLIDSNATIRTSHDDSGYHMTIDGLSTQFTAVANTSDTNLTIFLGWCIGLDIITDTLYIDGQDLVVEAKFLTVPRDAIVLVSTTYGSEGMGKFTLDGVEQEEFASLSNIPAGTRIYVSDNKLTIDNHVIEALDWSNGPSTFKFQKWVYILTGADVETDDRVGDLVSIGAVYERTDISWTITWLDDNDQVLKQTTVMNGSVPEYGEVPVKAADGEHIYLFTGWDPAPVAADTDATYRATYQDSGDKVLVTVDLNGGTSPYINESNGWTYDKGPQLYYKTVDKGTSVVLGPVTRASNVYNEYTFTEWTDSNGGHVGADNTVTAESFMVYTARYTVQTISYTIIWQDWDGSTISTKTLPYGTPVSHEDVARPETADASYSFAGWTRNGNPVDMDDEKVCGDATYVASYVTNYKSFTVTFDPNGGEDLSFQSKTVTYNSAYGILPTVTREGYSLNGWFTQGGQQIMPDTVFATAGNQTLHAEWTAILPDPDPAPVKPHPITKIEEEHTVNEDGSTTDKTTKTTTNTDGSSEKTVVEKTTTPDGKTTTTTTETKTDAKGNSETNVKVEFPDGGTVDVGYKGEGDHWTILPEIDVDIGDAKKISKEQEEVIDERIDEVIDSDQNPNVVIVTGTETSVPRSVLENIVRGNGSLTYIQDGNTLFFTAATIAGIGIPDVEDWLSIVLTDVPDGYGGKLRNSLVYSISMMKDGVEYHGLFKEPVKVTIPYQLSEGQTVSEIYVYYLGDSLEPMEFDYVDGCVVFYLAHMSLYPIVNGHVYETSEDFPWMLIAILVIAALLILAVAVRYKKHKA